MTFIIQNVRHNEIKRKGKVWKLKCTKGFVDLFTNTTLFLIHLTLLNVSEPMIHAALMLFASPYNIREVRTLGIVDVIFLSFSFPQFQNIN